MYDLYLRVGEKRSFLGYSDHGVTLSDQGIAWTAQGRDRQTGWFEIVEVHLQTGMIDGNMIASCRLRFADRSTLEVSSCNSRGFQDDALDQIYLQFIRDLHAQLVALGNGAIAFTAGVSETRYGSLMVLLFVAGLFLGVLPIVVMMMTGEWKLMFTLYSGLLLLWPVFKITLANAPRSYDPRDVPPELLPAKLGLPPAIDPGLLDSSD